MRGNLQPPDCSGTTCVALTCTYAGSDTAFWLTLAVSRSCNTYQFLLYAEGMRQVVPDATILRRYLDEGLTQAEIVEAWEKDSNVRVSRSSIGMAIDRYGLRSAHPRNRYEDLLPWKVLVEHRDHMDARMLRLEGRRRAGERLSHRDKVSLHNWLERLEAAGAVVHYDPDTPEGFHWVVPEEGDDDIIHRPKD